MTFQLSCLLAMFLFGSPAPGAQRGGCMGIRGFSSWAGTSSFPYRPASGRDRAVRLGFKQLKLGMTLEQVNSLIPQPDWAESELKGCTWYYAKKVKSDGLRGKGLTVRFGSERTVNGLGRYVIR